MRSIRHLHAAAYRPIQDLITYSPLPTRSLPHLDPFLFLNHHGHQVYPPHNHGLPFGPHPHRGMETITFIVAGDITHQDSVGYESIIKAGGVQWMTAGRGLIHAEVSSEAFKRDGGELEILQMWLNLPARLKMTAPNYVGLQKEQIPMLEVAAGVRLQLIAGIYQGTQGAFTPLTEIFMSTVEMKANSQWLTSVPLTHTVFFYVIRGSVKVNGQTALMRQLVEFDNDHEEIKVEATTDSLLIFGHAQPFDEPIVAQGPFVMNTEQEIMEAYHDYQMGKFGRWNR